ncbi:hypothetical protein D3C78_598280 [compost metagenome]
MPSPAARYRSAHAAIASSTVAMPSRPEARKRSATRWSSCRSVRSLPEARSISPDNPARLSSTTSHSGMSAKG